MKISEKIANYKAQGKTFYSFEFFPPKTDFGMDNLYSRIDRMASLQPAYIDITWGAGGSTSNKTLEMCKTIQKYFGLEVMMHLTCTNMQVSSIKKVLIEAEKNDLSNILALRGDPPTGQDNFVPAEGGFKHATELLRHVRDNFEFCLAAACYPEGHVESSDLITDMNYVKMKVENGADFLVTQLFYDNQDFFRLMERAETLGIDVPIIAGILPILNTNQIRRFTSLCGSKIPDELDIQLERYVDDDDAVRELGIEYATRQVQELWDQGIAGVHFYVLNRNYSVSKILDNLKLPGHIKIP